MNFEGRLRVFGAQKEIVDRATGGAVVGREVLIVP